MPKKEKILTIDEIVSNAIRSKAKEGRNIYGTIMTPDKGFNWKGDKDEVNAMFELFRQNKPYEYSVIGVEEHADGRIHYHYLVHYNKAVSRAIMEKHARHFYSLSKNRTDRLEFVSKGLKDVIGYCCKYSNYHTDGDTTKINIEDVVKRYKKKMEVNAVAKYECVEVSKAVKDENEIIDIVYQFMDKNSYKVNFYSRELIGISYDDFFIELEEKLKFGKLFGSKGITLIKQCISDRAYHRLPYWKPDIKYVKFEDCYYNMNTGQVEDVKDDVMPVYTFDFPISYELPVTFISILKYQGWKEDEIQRFRKSYGLQFKNKKIRTPMLSLHGVSNSGKSTLMLPFRIVFGDVVGDMTKDAGFSYGGVASYPKVIGEEICVFAREFDVDSMKKFLDGTEFPVKIKHGSSIKCVPKTGMFNCNYDPPSIDDAHDRAKIGRASSRERV